MPSISEFRRGMAIMFKDDIYLIVEFQHIKPGKGQAFIRSKLKNLRSGRVIDHTFRLNEKLEAVRLDTKPMQYLYSDETSAIFMDKETYDQVSIGNDIIGDQARFLLEGIEVKVLFHEKTAISVELPTTMEFEVTESEPAVRGDTAGNLTKWVTIETGAKVQVPPFISQGERVKIDTRDGSYVSRV
ncbi:elongation factor P [candidate division KSB1 bacterium]|nr:elongation factor P [candidate division KSB1 bacterium]